MDANSAKQDQQVALMQEMGIIPSPVTTAPGTDDPYRGLNRAQRRAAIAKERKATRGR